MRAQRRAVRPSRGPRHRVPLRASLWFLPVLMIGGAVALAGMVGWIDTRISNEDYPGFLDRGSAEDVRAVLGVVATSLISVLALVLSITIVALQLASANLGPRLLRGFVKDPLTQVTIGLFTGTFVFAVLTLSGFDGETVIPQLGTSTTILLAVACIVLLVFFINNIAMAVQVQNVVARVNAELRHAIADLADRAQQARRGHAADALRPEVTATERRLEAEGADVISRHSGYLQIVRFDTLVAAATGHDAVVRVRRRPGQFVLAGTPLATVWPAGRVDELAVHVEDALELGPNRTLRQDLAFAIDQLVEIALRALSPAVNDTFTALTCVDWLGEALRSLARVPVTWRAHADDAGQVRVLEEPLTYDDLVQSAFEKIRQSGAGNPVVTERIIDVLGGLGEVVTDRSQRAALVAEGERVIGAAHGPSWIEADREALFRRWADVRDRLGDGDCTADDDGGLL